MKTILNWGRKYFSGIQKSLLWILLGVVIYVTLTDLVFRNKCEKNSFCEYFVNCIYTLGLSYIASFIFYYLQVYLKQKQELKKIMPSIERLFSKLLGYFNDIVIDIANIGKSENKIASINEVNEDEFMSYVSKVCLDHGSGIYQGDTELTWLQYFSFRKEQIEDCRKVLLDYVKYLDDDCVTLLADVRIDQFLYTFVPNSILCQNVGINSSFYLDGADFLCNSLYKLIIRLNDYYKHNLLLYRKEKSNSIKAVYKGSHKQIIV